MFDDDIVSSFHGCHNKYIQSDTMGSCTSVKKKDTELFGDMEPENVQAWNNPNLPAVDTEIRISNVKLKHVPYTEASVLVSIPGILDIKLDKKRGPKSIKWTFDKATRVKLTQYELGKKFVYINVFQVGAVETKVAELKLNLYLIATGPYHLDFPIRYTNKMEGRASIDVKISQVVDVSVESVGASVHLLADRPSQLFNYSIRSIINAFKDTESESSYCERFVMNYGMAEQPNKRKSQKINTEKPEKVSKIIWTQQKADLNKSKLPSVKSRIIGSNVPNACLQFLLWTVEKATSTEDTDAVHLVGECYVSYNKLLSKEPIFQTRNGREYEIHDYELKDKLWNHGKHTADINLSVKITIPKFNKQMIVYIRTEEGIVKSSPVITMDAKAPECKELAELIISKDKIQEQIGTLAGMLHEHDQSINAIYKTKDLKAKILAELVRQQIRLEVSTKESALMYNYRSESEILKAQEVFLDIGFKLLMIVEDEDTGFRDTAFNCLVSLLKRGQLSLLYIGFKNDEKQQIQNGNMNKFLAQKFEIAIEMQKFLYQILRNVLNFLNQKALQQNQRMFVEIFCAYSYFRVPQFRHRLLEILTKPDDPPINEWRGTEYSLNEDKHTSSTGQDNTFSILFDWQSNYYNVIGHDERAKHNLQDLAEILDNQPWRHRMEKRGIGFFFFIIYWVKYVEQIAIISDHVKWQHIPGYTQLLRALLCQMKKRPIMDYPDSLIDASVKILANQKLLNIFVTILFKKTNMYDSNTVLKMIQILSRYFSELAKSKRHIPTNFNYNFFVAGLKTIIMSDHSYAIAKCLLLYYDHYNMLNITVKKDLNMFLLGRAFFKMFLNWSLNVRVIFHHLMVFRIFLQCNNVPTDKNTAAQQQYLINEEIKRRYAVLISILENAKEKKDQDDNMKFAYNYQKDYFKKMRKKLHDHRRVGDNLHVNKKVDQAQPKKYSLDELVRAPNVRMKSEAMGVKVSYEKPPTSEADLSMVISYLHGRAEESEQFQPSQQSSKKIMFKRLNSNQADSEVAEIDIKALEYLSKSLFEFREIEEKYQKFFSKNTAKEPVPEVTVKVPIDEVELRPFHIDEW